MEISSTSLPDNNTNENKYVKLEQSLESLIETLRQCTIIVEDFQQESQPILNSKL